MLGFPPSVMAPMIQQWELTDWWNNEQRHAGWMRVLAYVFSLPSARTDAADTSLAGRPPPAVPSVVPSIETLRASAMWKTNRFGDFFCRGAPPHLLALLFCRNSSLLINPWLSRWGFDARDGAVGPILSPWKLWRCHTVVAMGTTRAEGNPELARWENVGGSPHGRDFEGITDRNVLYSTDGLFKWDFFTHTHTKPKCRMSYIRSEDILFSSGNSM